MKSNPYADLRIDNRADLPAPWYDYPVLQSGEYRTEILYTSGRDYVKVHALGASFLAEEKKKR